MSETYLTRDGFGKLKEELMDFNRQKLELAKEIGEAREQGDLRENAGYIAAKERQGLVLKRINELEAKLRSAKIVEDLAVNRDDIRIGARVTVLDSASGRKLSYTLGGTDETDPAKGKISVSSPLAQGLLGAKIGEKVKITLPSGEKSFEILTVEY